MGIVDGTEGKPCANAAEKDVNAWVAKEIKAVAIIDSTDQLLYIYDTYTV